MLFIYLGVISPSRNLTTHTRTLHLHPHTTTTNMASMFLGRHCAANTDPFDSARVSITPPPLDRFARGGIRLRVITPPPPCVSAAPPPPLLTTAVSPPLASKPPQTPLLASQAPKHALRR